MKSFEETLRDYCVVKIESESGYEFTDVPISQIVEAHKAYEKQSLINFVKQLKKQGTITSNQDEEKLVSKYLKAIKIY